MSTEVTTLFRQHFGRDPDRVEALRSHGSARRIFRLLGNEASCIGVENQDVRENRAFIGFARHFASFSLPVPVIIAESVAGTAYLQQDLGDRTLFDVLSDSRTATDPFPSQIEALYGQALELLPRFQVEAGPSLDYSLCHHAPTFGREMMRRDMNYFRDEFLSRTGWSFDADALDRDFEAFADFLSGAEGETFLYRDFQSRNIMVAEGTLFFIDFQGGCKGPLHYDVASLLFQAAARIPDGARERLLESYLSALSRVHEYDKRDFLDYYYGFVYLRILQVLGTYGVRGLQERKQYFLDSIQFALENLVALYRARGLPVKMPEFERFILSRGGTTPVHPVSEQRLTVSLYSFSYKQESEVPYNPHGGGFVFDCRCLPNPGREKEYMYLSGLDDSVIAYLDAKEPVQHFFESISRIVDQSVREYIGRKFSSLSVAFGCTGGQHRSVYFTERIARYIKSKYDVDIAVQHLNRRNWLRESSK